MRSFISYFLPQALRKRVSVWEAEARRLPVPDQPVLSSESLSEERTRELGAGAVGENEGRLQKCVSLKEESTERVLRLFLGTGQTEHGVIPGCQFKGVREHISVTEWGW